MCYFDTKKRVSMDYNVQLQLYDLKRVKFPLMETRQKSRSVYVNLFIFLLYIMFSILITFHVKTIFV